MEVRIIMGERLLLEGEFDRRGRGRAKGNLFETD